MEQDPGAPPVPRGLIVASEWAWRLIAIAVAIVAVAYMAQHLSLVVVPVVVAMFVTALLEPVIARLVRLGLGPRSASVVAFVLGVLLIGGVVTAAVGQIVTNWDELADQAGEGLEQVTDWLRDGPLDLPADGVGSGVGSVLDRIRENPEDAFAGTLSVLSTTGGLLAGGVLAFVVTLFLVMDRRAIWRNLLSMAPAGHRTRVDRSGRTAWRVLVAYVRVTLAEAVFDSVLIGSAIVIAGVPVAFALSALVFLSVFIPIAGAILSGVIVVLVALVTKGLTTALVLAVVVLVVQQLDANVLYPFLTSRRVSIHPLASLLLVTAGGVLGGLVGAFVAVPFTGMALAARRAWLDGPAEALDESAEPVLDH